MFDRNLFKKPINREASGRLKMWGGVGGRAGEGGASLPHVNWRVWGRLPQHCFCIQSGFLHEDPAPIGHVRGRKNKCSHGLYSFLGSYIDCLPIGLHVWHFVGVFWYWLAKDWHLSVNYWVKFVNHIQNNY